MFEKKPMYRITDRQGKVLLFVYEYSEKKMFEDIHRNGLQHYIYFEEQVLSIIRRDYGSTAYIDTMELTEISCMRFLWHNLWAKIGNMITVIPALKSSYNVYKLSESAKYVEKKVIDIINKSEPKRIDLLVATNKDSLERFEKDGLVYNGALVQYLYEDGSSKLYVYKDNKFVLLDTNFISSIADDSGNISQDKT